MADSGEVTLDGFRQLDDTFYALGKALGKGVLRRVGRKALEPMAEHARAAVKVRTGRLQRSIHVGTVLAKSQRGKGPTRVAGTGDFRMDPSNDVMVYMGPGQDPAAIQEEFGNAHQSADPFMRPAFDAEAEATIKRVADGLWPEIEKTAARKAKRDAKRAAG